jgi:hypothetical protein
MRRWIIFSTTCASLCTLANLCCCGMWTWGMCFSIVWWVSLIFLCWVITWTVPSMSIPPSHLAASLRLSYSTCLLKVSIGSSLHSALRSPTTSKTSLVLITNPKRLSPAKVIFGEELKILWILVNATSGIAYITDTRRSEILSSL